VRLLSHARNSNSHQRAAQNTPVAKQGGREAFIFKVKFSRADGAYVALPRQLACADAASVRLTPLGYSSSFVGHR
jgi:hypothetical protein